MEPACRCCGIGSTYFSGPPQADLCLAGPPGGGTVPAPLGPGRRRIVGRRACLALPDIACSYAAASRPSKNPDSTPKKLRAFFRPTRQRWAENPIAAEDANGSRLRRLRLHARVPRRGRARQETPERTCCVLPGPRAWVGVHPADAVGQLGLQLGG